MLDGYYSPDAEDNILYTIIDNACGDYDLSQIGPDGPLALNTTNKAIPKVHISWTREMKQYWDYLGGHYDYQTMRPAKIEYRLHMRKNGLI